MRPVRIKTENGALHRATVHFMAYCFSQNCKIIHRNVIITVHPITATPKIIYFLNVDKNLTLRDPMI